MADELGNTAESAGQFQGQQSVSDEAKTEQAIVQEIVDFVAFVKSYEQHQRQAEEEEAEFEGFDMWTEEARSARAEQEDDASGRKIPGRPMVSVWLLDQGIQQVVTDARQARLALTVKPKAGIANTKASNYMKGLVRTIQTQSGALAIRLWALERTAKVGRGGYRIDTGFANDGDFDLDLTLERILDYSTVYWSPYSQRANRSDAKGCVISDWISRKDRLDRWSDKPLVVPERGWLETDDWFAGGEATPAQQRVRIATYFKVEDNPRTLAYHPQVGKMWLDEMPPACQIACLRKEPGTRTRPVPQPKVLIYVVDGAQVLEQSEWVGRYIPIIEVIGKEYFLKGKRRFKGITCNAMDLIRAINVLLSSAVELAGQMPRSPYLIAAGQDTGFEDQWDDLFTKAYTRIPYNPVDVNGSLAPPPQRTNMEPQIQGLVLLLQMLQQFFHATTGSVAPQLRAVNPYDRSGKAIEALQRQGAAGTGNYLDNLATISMLYEGECLVDAIPNVYDTPGRVVRIFGEDTDEEVAIMIKRPFVRDQDGTPVAVPCPHCDGAKRVMNPVPLLGRLMGPQTCPVCQGTGFATKDSMPKEFQGRSVEYVDFSEARWIVQPVVDRNYDTKQDEAMAGMMELARAAPELVPAYAADWVRSMGFSGSNKVADAIEAAFPKPGKELGDESVSPRVAGEFKRLQAEHAQMQQALAAAQRLLETDAIKQAGAKELAQIKAALELKREDLRGQMRVLEMDRKSAAQAGLETIRGRIEAMAQESEQKFTMLHDILLQLLKEKGNLETERHAASLHDEAAQAAEQRLEEREIRKAVREEDREVRTEERQTVREEQSGGAPSAN